MNAGDVLEHIGRSEKKDKVIIRLVDDDRPDYHEYIISSIEASEDRRVTIIYARKA